jgi:lipopolysaccharide biosynthesis glycosyltransferase
MSINSAKLTILVTSDTTYIPLVATLLSGIHRFLPYGFCLEAYWLHVDNEQGPREELAGFCQKFLPQCNLHISTCDTLPANVQACVETLIDRNVSSWGPALCFAAPFVLPMILPPSVSRAVFVDADVLALGDVSELATMPLDGLPAGCVRAPLRRFKNRLGLQKYCNSGVVAIDVETWKNEGVSESAIEYLHKISGSWGANFPDQDALNVTLADSKGKPRWKELHPKWNACSPLFTKAHWGLLYQPIPIGEVKFLHYCGAKPWDRVPATLLGRIARRKGIQFGPTKPAHPHADLFFELLAKTPFKSPR